MLLVLCYVGLNAEQIANIGLLFACLERKVGNSKEDYTEHLPVASFDKGSRIERVGYRTK
jgi:hypothetical protein